MGIKAPETSIHAAWVSAIAGAQHYVYVENQFFISGRANGLKNQIIDALFDRIVKAHEEELEAGKREEEERAEGGKEEGGKEEGGKARGGGERSRKRRKFRVYVIIPLLPSFRGERFCVAELIMFSVQS